MSRHDTLTTGRLARPQRKSSGLCLHPRSAMQASHSSKPDLELAYCERFGDADVVQGDSKGLSFAPIVKLPAGTTTISGHSGQSLKLSPGFRQRFSLPTSASTPEQVVSAVALGEVSSMAVARLPLFL